MFEPMYDSSRSSISVIGRQTDVICIRAACDCNERSLCLRKLCLFGPI